MQSLAVAAVLILLGAPDTELDLLLLKTGRRVRGIILSETKEKIVFRIYTKGRKGQITATGTAHYSRDEILRIERMSDAERRKARKQTDEFHSKPTRMAAALKKIRTSTIQMTGKRGLRAVGTHFEISSTCDETFVKEVTYYLDRVFDAYRKNFEIRGDAGRRIRVYVLPGFDEYLRFQKQQFGKAIRNPAFYSIKANVIVAYSTVQRSEAERVRKDILKHERKIKGQMKEVKDAEDEIRKEAAKARSKVNADADRVRAKIRGDLGGEKSKRLRKVESLRAKLLAEVKSQEKAAMDRLKVYRKEADRVIEYNRNVIAKNRRVLRDQNRVMFEGLFHEGFHAFSRNFLWPAGRTVFVPLWLDEGLATYYEMSVVEADELVHGAPHPRFVALFKKAQSERKLLRIEVLLNATAAQFQVAHQGQEERSSLHYAQSWALAHYMVGRVTRARMTAYVAAVVMRADKVKAFEAMMGKSVRQVEAAVRLHIANLQ